MSRTPAARRYLRRFIPMILAYVAVLFASSFAMDALDPRGLPLIVLSVLPALPIIGVLVVIGLYLAEETDEYLRTRIVTAMLIGTGAVLSVATVLGFMQIGGVVARVDVFWAFPIWCGVWGLAQCGLSLRDRIESGQ